MSGHRILFVSSTIGGGSGRSQRNLARGLRARGHDVRFLVDDERPAVRTRMVGERLADMAARLRAIAPLAARVGARLDTIEHDGVEMTATPFPENGFPTLVDRWQPDVVVGNSMIRYSWRRIREACLVRQLPTVLYIRGIDSFTGLDIEPDPADAIVANARSLQAAVHGRGHDCAFVPSVVDTAATDVASTREVALLVNPIETHGIERLWRLAAALPAIQFVLQESWDLTGDQLASIERRLRTHPNVVLRRRRPAGPELYADARLLLAPHRIDNRPRVVIEAHANGIPAFVSDFGGLREAVGDAGIVLADDDDAWIDAVRKAFDEPDTYAAWSRAATMQRDRPDLDPAVIVADFEAVLDQAIGRHRAPQP